MKRSVILFLLLGILAFALPFSFALAAEGDPANVLAVGETHTFTEWHRVNCGLATESLTPGILTVNYDVATGVSPGTGVVRCTWTKWDGTSVTEDIQVKVYPAPTSVSLSETNIKLGVGESYGLTASIPEGTLGSVYFSCNTSKIGISQDGMSVGLWPYETCVGNVTVTTHGKTATCRVEVVPGPTGVSLSPTTLTLFKGQTHTLTAEVLGGYTKKGIQFWSADTNVCTVSKDGLVTAKAAGNTYVEANVYSPFSKYCEITIYDEPDAIILDGIQNRVGAGDNLTFTPRDSKGTILSLALTFSDPTVLTRGSGNTLQALKAGTCTVTASSALKSASRTITVVPAPSSLALSPSEVTLKELETAALTPILQEGTISSILYDSNNNEVATVSESGVITARSPGSARISARTYNSVYAYCNVTVAPSAITYTLAPKTAQVGINRTLQLRLTDPDGKTVPATYASDRDYTASVDANGLVTGKYHGTAIITATVTDGRKYTATIEVVAIPDYITVTPEEMFILKGQGEYFQVSSDVGHGFLYTSKSSNTKVARIRQSDDFVEAVGEGTAIVTVTSFNGKTAVILVTVFPEDGPLIPGAGFIALLGVGQSVNMDVRDMYGKAIACTYVSSDPKACSVNSKGMITGLKGNTASLVTATAKDGRTCETAVGVYPAPTYLHLNKDKVSLPVKGTFQLIPEVQPDSLPIDITFTTSNRKVAIVSADGKITAKGAGTCTITAKTYNGKTDTVTVTVGSAPTSVSLSPSKLTLGLNESRKLTVTLSPGAVSEYSFQCDNPSVLSISDNGTVTGLALGSTKLTVKTYNGKTAECLVTVVKAPGSVKLSSPSKAIGVKQTVQLKASLPKGTASAIKYTSGNTKIATVDSSGKVTGIKTGSVTITATTYNGKKASVTLQVKKAPSSIKLNTKSAKMGVGDTLTLTATLSSGSAGTYSYKSSNAKVASVDKNGLVTAVTAGRATITATTYNGKKTTCSVTVYKQPGSVSVKSAYTLKLGRTFALSVKFPKNTYSRVTFASSDVKVATVDSAGKVRGVGRGTATITVTATNGKTAKCVVTVR